MKNSKEIKRILVRSTNWIGDAVMTSPAIRAIRKNFPEARITLLAKPWVVPVFAHSPDIDDIRVYQKDAEHRGIPGIFRLARELRKARFDAAFLLQNAIEAALIVFLAGIPRRIGFNTDGRGLLLTRSVSCTRTIKSLHQIEYYQEMLRGAGLAAEETRLYLQVGDEDRAGADRLLKSEGIEEASWIAGINPSATFGPAKQWPPERFARLSDRLAQQYGGSVLIFGGPGDAALGEEIQARMNRTAVNLAGRTSLGEAMALIERCRLFVTNDSGLMHVAAALAVPLVAVFGSTNPVTTGPVSAVAKVVRTSVSCSPCLKPQCPYGHLECMDRISVDHVHDAAMELLNTGESKNGNSDC